MRVEELYTAPKVKREVKEKKTLEVKKGPVVHVIDVDKAEKAAKAAPAKKKRTKKKADNE